MKVSRKSHYKGRAAAVVTGALANRRTNWDTAGHFFKMQDNKKNGYWAVIGGPTKRVQNRRIKSKQAKKNFGHVNNYPLWKDWQ